MKKIVLLLVALSFLSVFAQENTLYENINTKLTSEEYKNINWDPYMKELERTIKANWRPPRCNESKRIVVMFTAAKNGDLSNLKIFKSSGIPLADKAAIEAVKQSSPFRPLPEEFKGDSVPIEFTFDYNILIKSDGRTLNNNPIIAYTTSNNFNTDNRSTDTIYLASYKNKNFISQNANKQNAKKNKTATPDKDSYISYLQNAIESNWNPPKDISEGKVVIGFKIKKDGSILTKIILESSCTPEEEEQAMKAIDTSSPFLSFPQNLKLDDLLIYYTFYYLN